MSDREQYTAAAAEARAQVDALIEERADLPRRRREALVAEDQAAFFAVENRIAVIDEQILAAEADLATAELELAWLSAETLVADEQAVRERFRIAGSSWRSASEAARLAPPASKERERAAATAAELQREYVAADFAGRDATEAANLALVQVERLEGRIEALTGVRPASGEGLRARPRPVARHITVHGPRVGETVELDEGERPPRWAVRLMGAHCWELAKDKIGQALAERSAAAEAARPAPPEPELHRLEQSVTYERETHQPSDLPEGYVPRHINLSPSRSNF
jgi:hypothetical protein